MNDKRKQLIWNLRIEGKSIPQICKELGVGKGTVGYYLKDFSKINKLSNSKLIPVKSSILDKFFEKGFNKEQFINESIKCNNSLSHLKIIFDVSKYSIKFLQKEFNITTNKNPNISGRGKYRDFSKLLSGEETLKNSYHNSFTGTLKRYLYRNGIKTEKCEDCGITEWNGKKVSFDLEHIDGNSSNNLLENLKILCPNCHSQTPTYKGRNKNKN